MLDPNVREPADQLRRPEGVHEPVFPVAAGQRDLSCVRRRSGKPSALKRKMPLTPAKPLGSINAPRVKRWYGVPGDSSATSDTAS